jgi:hypothetical protein
MQDARKATANRKQHDFIQRFGLSQLAGAFLERLYLYVWKKFIRCIFIRHRIILFPMQCTWLQGQSIKNGISWAKTDEKNFFLKRCLIKQIALVGQWKRGQCSAITIILYPNRPTIHPL